MENINIHISRKRSVPGRAPIHIETPFDRRSGFFGVVTEVQAKTNTVTVRADFGRDITGIRVASPQWVTIPTGKGKTRNKEKLTGKRHLPPVNAYVYCLMPTGEPSSAIALCSVFAYQDPNHAGFKEDSEAGAFIDKQIDSGGWMCTHDTRTGTRKIQNSPKDGEETISLEVNQEEDGKNKITLRIYKNKFEFYEENKEVSGTIKGTVRLNVEGDLNAKIKGDADIHTDGKVKINGGGQGAARKNDKVKVRIPANSFIVSVSGQATGTPNAAPVEVDGEIVDGSESVEIGG